DPEALSKKYRRSHAYTKYVIKRQKALRERKKEGKKTKSEGAKKAKKRSPGIFRQFGILTGRYWNLVMRDRLLLGILLAVMPVIGIMLAAMAQSKDLTGLNEAGIADHFAAKFEPPEGVDPEEFASYTVVDDAQKLLFMAALAVVMLGLFAAAYEVIKERHIYKRERMVNLGIGPYLLSKVLVLFSFSLLQCAALLGALMLFVEMPVDGVFFWAPAEMYVTLLLTALASILMGLFVSSLTPSSNAVIYLVLLVVFSQILFTGTIFDLPKHAKPVSLGMVTRWSLEALGSSVDMDDLDKKSEMRLKKTVEVEPGQLGDSVGPLLENAGLELDPIPLDEKFLTPIEPELRYKHDRKHLEMLWSGLGIFSLAFLILTWITLAWRDRQED
ncbi:MAG: ABC transporter permease, partial [Planctomycetota bacterium]